MVSIEIERKTVSLTSVGLTFSNENICSVWAQVLAWDWDRFLHPGPGGRGRMRTLPLAPSLLTLSVSKRESSYKLKVTSYRYV